MNPDEPAPMRSRSLLFAALALALPLAACEVEEEGELPEVEVENGELPEVDVPDSIDVELEEDTLVVPAPDVETGGSDDERGSPRY